MTKILHIFISCGCLMLVNACTERIADIQKPDVPDDGYIRVPMTFSAESPKTVLEVGGAVWWSGKQETISVFDGTGNCKFTSPEKSEASEGTIFSGSAAEVETYYASYPYNANATFSNGIISGLEIKNVQTATAGSFDPDANVSVAVSNPGYKSFHFLNVCALIKISLAQNQNFTKIIIKSINQEPIAGTFSAAVENGDVKEITDGKSSITLSGTMTENNTYYVVVLPSVLEGGISLEYYDGEGGNNYLGSQFTTAAITFAKAKTKPLGTVKVNRIPPPTCALPGIFSISATQKVRFAPGNLQYQASTGTWRFAEHQYDIIADGNEKQGNVPNGDNTQISAGYTGWIDLFGWGATGMNGIEPYTSTKEASDYYGGGSGTSNLLLEDGSDWGYVVSGNSKDVWRLLAKDEISYLKDNRTGFAAPEKKYSYVKITISNSGKTIYGYFYYPDGWKISDWPSGIAAPGRYEDSSNVSALTYSIEEFDSITRSGILFMPNAGYRKHSETDTRVISVSLTRGTNKYIGCYWTSTNSGASNSQANTWAVGTDRGSGTIGTVIPSGFNCSRYDGYPVRLVQAVPVTLRKIDDINYEQEIFF